MNHVCDRLDPYLLDLLEPGERSVFAEHLAGCAACQRELELQRRIDCLLRRAADLEAAPPLGLRFKRRLRRRRTLRWGAVAGLLLAATAWAWPWRQARHAGSIATTPPQAHERLQANVSVELGDNVIARPLESNDPRVTIVWTYPVLEARPPGGS